MENEPFAPPPSVHYGAIIHGLMELVPQLIARGADRQTIRLAHTAASNAISLILALVDRQDYMMDDGQELTREQVVACRRALDNLALQLDDVMLAAGMFDQGANHGTQN
jgi:hypothetical protein